MGGHKVKRSDATYFQVAIVSKKAYRVGIFDAFGWRTGREATHVGGGWEEKPNRS